MKERIDKKKRIKCGDSSKAIALLFGVFLAVTMLASLAVAAEKPVELKIAFQYSPENIMFHTPTWWANELDKRTNGRVKATVHAAELLGKSRDFPHMVETGLCEMAVIAPPHNPGKNPVASIRDAIFFFAPDILSGTDLLYELYYRGLMNPEFEGASKKLMWVQSNPPNILFSKKKITKLEDLKGMKIRSFPGYTMSFFQALGATPVGMAAPEVYMAMDRGVVEAGITASEFAMSGKWNEVTKYCLYVPLCGGEHVVVMNLKVWESLPADIRLIMERLNAEARYIHINEQFRRLDYGDEIGMLKKAGWEVSTLSPGELERWEKVVAPVKNKVIQELKDKNKNVQMDEVLKVVELVNKRYESYAAMFR